MNQKKWIKKSSAILLAFCMVVSIVLQQLPMISKAGNGSQTPESMGYTTRVDFEDFTKEQGTISERYEAGTANNLYVGKYTGESLNETYLDVDISISSTNWSDALYFGSTDGWNGISISIRSGELFVKDAGTGKNAFYDLVGLGLVTSINDEFNLKLGLKQGTDATYAIWVNNVFVAESTFANTSAKGMKLAVRTSTGYVTLKSGIDQRSPEDLGYKTKVTFEDFAKTEGTVAERYEAGTNNTVYVGTYTGASLNGTYLDADISLSSTNWSDALYFGSTDGWNGISISIRSGELFVKDAGTGKNAFYDLVGLKLLTTINDEFNLKLGLKQGTNATYAIWVNNVFVAEGTFANTSATGTKLAVRTSTGYVTIKTPIEKRTPEELGYSRVSLEDFGLNHGTYYSEVVSGNHYTGAYGDETTGLNMKYLDIDTSFEVGSSNSHINYGGNDGWYGIRIFGKISDGNEYLVIKDAGTGGTNQEYNLTKKGISIHEPFNIKLATKYVENTQGGTDVTYTLWLNNECVGSHTFASMPGIGNMIGICTTEGNINVGTYSEKTLSPVSYDLSNGAYLVSGTKVSVYKDGELLENVNSGATITIPGNYIIKRTDNLTKYIQNVSLYNIGDVNCDGGFLVESDLATLQELLNGKTTEYKATVAAEYAADLDNDGNVGNSDLKLMKEIQEEKTTLEDVLARYHVPALTYDYLGGDDVMPINGFYGPHNSGTNNYNTEEVFRLIKESGVNLISYSRNKINSANSGASILESIALAEKYGLGYYVEDARLNTEITLNGEINADAAVLDQTTLAKYLSVYSHHENYLGTFMVDEPYPNLEVYNTNVKQLQYYDSISKMLNGFTNNSAFINVWPSYATWTNSMPYGDYLEELVDSTDAKVLSFDHYIFELKTAGVGQGAHNAKSYFESLAKIRNVAKTNGIPFWGYVQAGGDFAESTGDYGVTDTDSQPSEAETYWNVNTLLAFGAKGIGWFPLVQPDDYALGENPEAPKDSDRNGLLGVNATTEIESDVTKWTTPFYEYAKNINKHIAAIDEVLMKAQSTAIIATDGYAKSQTKDSLALVTSTEKLQSVVTNNTQYGALVGCFDYRDTEAFYVVNYDVTKAQEITLNFAENYDYRQIQNAVTTYGSGKNVTLTIPAGEAVLIVIEDRMVEVQDISEYRGTTADANKAPDAEPGYVFGGWYETVPEDLGYKTRVTLEEFLKEQGTTAERYEAGTSNNLYVGKYTGESLDETYLDVDISISSTNWSDVLYFGSTNGWDGISISIRSGELFVKDAGTGKNAFYDLVGLGLVTSINDEFNLKLGLKQGTDATYAIWVNNVFVAEDTFANTTATGTKLAVRTSTGHVTLKSGVDQRTPKDLGYKTHVTIEDFIKEQGTIAERYEVGTANSVYVGKYTGESLDETYLDVDISISSTNWSDQILFGSTDGWNGISISIRSGELFVKDSGTGKNAFYDLVGLGLVKTINDEFNLKFGLKQGTDATYAIWVNNVFVAEGTFANTSATGTKLAVRTSTGYVTLKSSIELDDNAGRVSLSSYKTSGVACAKFVDEDILTVKTQITADTTATSESADIRFVTTVDSLNYDEVGFLITPQGGEQVKVSSAFALKKLYGVAEDDTALERDDFLAQYGSQSRYFVTYSCADILKNYFGNTYTVIPYWKTQDGTIVYGGITETSISKGIGIQTEVGTDAPWSDIFATNAEVTKENLNGDGILSDVDITFLRKGLLSDTTNERYDMNSDESMDVKDIVRLKKVVVNFDERDGLFVESNSVAIAQWGDLF